MEEHRIPKHKYSSSHNLLHLIARNPSIQQTQYGRIEAKLNQCFSKQRQKVVSNRVSLQPLKELNRSRHLRKKSNKIEHNIKAYRDVDSRIFGLRRINTDKKTQLIVDRPYYQHFFTPKTHEEITLKHQLHSENDPFSHRKPPKSPLTSLHSTISSWQNSPKLQSRTNSLNKKYLEMSFYREDMGVDMNMTRASLAGKLKQVKKRQIHAHKDITVYSRQELENYYHSIVKFSRGNNKKYKDGLQSMLNLMEVQFSEKILSQEFDKLKTNPSLQQFITAFTNLVDAAFRQNVMDFFDIIFQECGPGQLNRQSLTTLLSQRMRDGQAEEIVEEIFQLLNPEGKTVSMTDVLTLCCTNDGFCQFMRKFSIGEAKK